MDDYREELYENIMNSIACSIHGYTPSEILACSAGLHELAQEVEGLSDIIFNYNEKGRLHSKYLDNRYEPAITLHSAGLSEYYYLFDGEIKDCVHPLNITISDNGKFIEYYSSERIQKELPTQINKQRLVVFESYNGRQLTPLLEGYKHGEFKIAIADYPKQNYFRHDCMEPIPQFKFAD